MEKLSICGCLLNASMDELPRYLKHPHIDLLEWRLDSFIHNNGQRKAIQAMHTLSTLDRHPVVATNRPEREGGLFAGAEEERISVLQKAVEYGADWIDLEDDVHDDHLEWFQTADVRILISHHDFGKTPERVTLQRLVENMAKKGANAVKIATLAQCPEDNLKILDLITFGKKKLAVDVIAFCMGPLGRWSRLACVLLGSPWTYAQLTGQTSAAPGQLTVEELRAALELIL